MAAQLLSVTNSPNQQITANLVVNGATLTLNIGLSYNQYGQFWAMSISDQFGNPLVNSAPLLTGVWPAANILSPYDYMGIGSAYLINQNGALTDWPNDTNLGNQFALLWDDNPTFAGGDNAT